MTPNPCNCSTCEWWQFHRMNECDILGYLSNDTQELIKKIGCLSHPGASEYLMQDVIKKMEHKFNESFNRHTLPESAYADGMRDAIALIKEGMK